MKPNAFAHLEQTFRRADLLPQLPDATLRLVDMVEQENPSLAEIEALLSRDPAMVARLLRVANSSAYAGHGEVTTIRTAIIRLGLGSIRALAISISLQTMMSRPVRECTFKGSEFVRHSLFVAFLARHATERVIEEDRNLLAYRPDEAFSAGIMHDLSVALLARVAPDYFDRVAFTAARKRWSFVQAFSSIFDGSLGDLGLIAAKAWNLPKFFEHAIQLSSPFPTQGNGEFWALLRWADAVANASGFGLETWEVDEVVQPDPDGSEYIESVALNLNEFMLDTGARVA